jgi:adenosine deaminase
LRREWIPITVCPLSNVKLRIFRSIQDHNIKRLIDEGLCVTVNSDDPAYFGGYVNENLIAVQEAFQLTKEEVLALARNSFQASFLSQEEKQRRSAEVEMFGNQATDGTDGIGN